MTVADTASTDGPERTDGSRPTPDAAVVLHRLEHEFSARAELQHLAYTIARRAGDDGATALAGERGTDVLTRSLDGAKLAPFSDRWRLDAVVPDHPGPLLEPLVAGGAG